MTHIFISYSHKDKNYARALADSLEKKGLPVWIDDRIDYGSKWPRVIQENLDKCDVFIVIMTPRSYESDWVHNELSRAQDKGKLIFPLLLEGDTSWLSIQSIQYVDVRGGQLPPPRFYEMLTQELQQKTVGEEKEIDPYQLHKGDIIHNRYEIEEGVAFGEIFALYKASDAPLVRNVLLGVNHGPLAEENLDEAKKGAIKYAAMQHPNIPRVYDYFTYGAQLYIILEYREMEKYAGIIKIIEGILL